MKITRKKTTMDWERLRPDLNKSDDKALWQNAFNDFFQGRIESRYLDPINKLKEHDSCDGYGFTILTLLCSLIEFLESTYQGKKYNYRHGKNPNQFEYSNSKECFIDFLTKRKPFEDVFNKSSAEEFYSSVRCGLLHEASTKNGWIIKFSSSSGSEIIDFERKIVFRNDFEKSIREYISLYEHELLSKKEVQDAFIRKFDALCEK